MSERDKKTKHRSNFGRQAALQKQCLGFRLKINFSSYLLPETTLPNPARETAYTAYQLHEESGATPCSLMGRPMES